MSILNLKKNKKALVTAPKKLAVKAEVVKTGKITVGSNTVVDSSIIVRPRVTEKATMLAEANVYAFEVSPRANATKVKQAVRALYKVEPVKVAMIKIPRKKVLVRGKIGMHKPVYKAYVYLKKGDQLKLV